MMSIRPRLFQGFVETLSGYTLRGGAWRLEDLSARLTVDISRNGHLVARCVADQFRDDLLSAGIGDGRFGFSVDLPAELFDGIEKSLEIRDASTGQQIVDPFRCAFLPVVGADPAPSVGDAALDFVGHVDAFQGHQVLGWAMCPQKPHLRATVDLVDEEGRVVGTARAAQFRPDLRENGIGDGFHAFVIRPNANCQGLMKVSARVRGARSFIAGSPMEIDMPIFRDNEQLFASAKSFKLDHANSCEAVLFMPDMQEPIPRTHLIVPAGQYALSQKLPGEGWDTPAGTRAGMCIGPSCDAALYLARLPVKSVEATLQIAGKRLTAETLTIWLDEKRIPCRYFATRNRSDGALIFTLPAADSIVSTVVLRFMLPPDTDSHTRESLVFQNLIFSE